MSDNEIMADADVHFEEGTWDLKPGEMVTLAVDMPPGFVGCQRCRQLVEVAGTWYGDRRDETGAPIGSMMQVMAHVCRGESRLGLRLIRGPSSWVGLDCEIVYVNEERHAGSVALTRANGGDADYEDLRLHLLDAGFSGPFTRQS